MRITQTSSKKFTLIELLVVISIIAILAGMLLPALGTIKEHGRKIDCMSRFKQLSITFATYLAGNNDNWPTGTISNEGSVNASRNFGTDWVTEFYKKFKGNECPSLTGGITIVTASFYDHVFKLKPRPVSKGIYLSRKPLAIDIISFSPKNYTLHNISRGLSWGKGFCGWEESQGALQGSYAYTAAQMTNLQEDWSRGRHNGTVNVVMIDGHVKNYTNKKVYTTLRNGSNVDWATSIYRADAKGFED